MEQYLQQSSAVMNRTFVLTGGRLGKTCVLKVGTNKYQFFKGKLTLNGPINDLDGIGLYVARCYQAYPEGSLALEEALYGKRSDDESTDPGGQSTIQSEVRSLRRGTPPVQQVHGSTNGPSGENPATNLSHGAGQSDSGLPTRPIAEIEGRLFDAVVSLDPDNIEHWTTKGYPRVDAVEAAFGSSGITRSNVEAVAPGITRELVQKARAMEQGNPLGSEETVHA